MDSFFIYFNMCSYLIVAFLVIGILLIPNRTKSLLSYFLMALVLIILCSHFLIDNLTGNTYFYDFCEYLYESLKDNE